MRQARPSDVLMSWGTATSTDRYGSISSEAEAHLIILTLNVSTSLDQSTDNIGGRAPRGKMESLPSRLEERTGGSTHVRTRRYGAEG